MKKSLLSGALAASLAMPAMAINIYDGENGKVDVYGSIRAYAGLGNTADRAGNDNILVLGIQNNSQFGVRFSRDKFKANVQFGGEETGINAASNAASNGANLREFWGSYDSDFGTILVGKATTVDNDTGFFTNWLNNDNGLNGFGQTYTGNRHTQIQYKIAGFAAAVLTDNDSLFAKDENQAGRTSNNPRLALSYTINEGGKPFFKIAGSYLKLYNAKGFTPQVSAGADGEDHAYHVWAGIRPTFGSSHISITALYGKNSRVYGGPGAKYSVGTYTHLDPNGFGATNAHSTAGAALEYGIDFNKELSFNIGAGYQQTKSGTTGNNGKISGTAVYLNLPYSPTKGVSVTPQVAYYSVKASGTGATVTSVTSGTSGTSPLLTAKSSVNAVFVGVRFKYDF